MNRQEKENLINSLGQKEERKSFWARTRGIALIFNSLIAGFDRGIGSVAHYVRTSDQRKVFQVRRRAIRKAKRDEAVAVRKIIIDEKVTKAKTSISNATNAVKASVNKTATVVKNDVNEKTSVVKKVIADKTEISRAKVAATRAKADETRAKAAETRARRTAEKAARDEERRIAEEKRKEEERIAEEKRKEEERIAEEKRKEEERIAEEKRKEEERIAGEKRKEEERLAEEARQEQIRLKEEARAQRAAMLIEQARQEELRREEEKKRQAEEAALLEAERLAEAERQAEEAALLEAERLAEAERQAEEVARKEAERLEKERRLAIEAEKQRQEELAQKRAEAERIRQERELRRYESAALFKANEEYKIARRLETEHEIARKRAEVVKRFSSYSRKYISIKQAREASKIAKIQAQKSYEEQLSIEKEVVARLKLEAERYKAELLKQEADRLINERIAREEAERIREEELEAERKEIALKQQAEIERIKAERFAREEAEKIETKKREYIQLAISVAKKLEAEAYTSEKEVEDQLVAQVLTAAKQKARQEELERAELQRKTRQYVYVATTKAEEQRRIASIQNKKLEKLFRRNAFKESVVEKYNNAKNYAATRALEVREHAQNARDAVAQRTLDKKAAAAEKVATSRAINLANSLAERARNEELAREKAELKKEQERIAQAAAESLRLERERKEAERAQTLAEEKSRTDAIDIAVRLAEEARTDAIEFERQAFARIKDDEKQQKVLERQVDAELKKLKKEADRFAADEKKKEEQAIRKHEKAEANFARRKRSLRRSKKIEKSSARLQRSAQTAFHKWSAYLLHIVICIVVSAVTCFFVMWMQPESTLNISGLWLLNFWPILISGIAFAFLCQNAFISSAINLVLWSLLSMANTIKIEVRDDPVYLNDLLLIKEAITASAEYDIDIPKDDIGILIGCVVALLICGIVYAIDNRGKISVIRKMAGKLKCAIVRFGGFIVSIAVLVALVLGVYSSDELYKQFDLASYDHVSKVYSSLGFPFSFCHYAKAYSPQKPEGYNKNEAMFYGQNIKTEVNDPKVHVIMIMDEAYSDLTDLGIMNFNEDNDPQFMFKQMAASKNAISGHIVVPGFAGGTAHTEFDIVTGMQTNMLSDSNITAFRILKNKEESLMSVLHEAGYTTQFEHVGSPWYYNRENAYKLLGADETLFKNEMKDIRYKGFYISDDYVATLIKDRFNKAIYDNEWLFSYNVTIQNHMSYTTSKYAEWTIDHVDVMATLTKDTQDAINVYAEGIRDANYMLYHLYNFFNETDEPVMLVFFGDHMPYLGDGRKGYKELGIDDVYSENKAAALKMYETPYLIWCNDAGAKAIDFENAVENLNLPKDGVIQASYLGSVVLDLIGEGDISQWFSYLSEARQNIPVTKFVTEENEFVDRLKKWTYYKITN